MMWTGTPVQNNLKEIQDILFILTKVDKIYNLKIDNFYENIKNNLITYFIDDNRKI